MDNSMDLFDYMRKNTLEQEAPLASRLRPKTLEEIVGQRHILGKDKLLYRAIKADKLSSLIFYGPPGTGKTTIARVIANTTKASFTQLNATVAGKKDMEAVVSQAKDNLGMYGRKTILFVDEIHRFNKGQQDYLLPFVEDGTVILIGATTENPYFEVNGALISRSVVFELKALEPGDVKELIHRAVYDEERGMGAYQAVITEEAADFLADIAGGDARSALNAVELGILIAGSCAFQILCNLVPILRIDVNRIVTEAMAAYGSEDLGLLLPVYQLICTFSGDAHYVFNAFD